MEVNSKHYFFGIWAGVALIAFVIVWNLTWRFQVNDDLIMMWLVSGAYTGTPESYAVFIHPILSWIFSKVYTFQPEFPWYSGLWFTILFLSYLLILKKIASIHSSLLWKYLFSGFLLMIVLHFCFFLQFTIVAGFAALASLLILSSPKNSFSNQFKVLAWIVLVFSFLIRWESFVLIGLGFLLYFLLFTPKSDYGPIFRLSLTLLLIIGFLVGTKYTWENNSEYAEFLTFNKARASVIDHPVFYEQIKSKQIEENSEWFHFARWMFEDDGVSISDLQFKKKELDSGLYSTQQVFNSFKRLFAVQKMEAFKSFISIALVLIALVYSEKAKKIIAFAGLWFLFLLVFNHFFILNGRVTILFFLVFLFPIFNHSTFPAYPTSRFVLAYGLLMSLFGFHVFNFLEEARGRKVMHQEFESLLESLPENELVILEGYMEHNYYFDYSLKKQVPIISLGWISRSPFQQKAFKKFGISSLEDANHFSLFGIRNQRESLYFPAYMNSVSGHFYLNSEIESSNFLLKRFSKP